MTTEKEQNNSLLSEPAHSTSNGIDTAVNHHNPTESLVDAEDKNEDQNFRRKLFLHCVICFSMFNVGWSLGMRGPAFADLMKITDVSSGSGSVFVSANYGGLLVGSILCGLIIDRFNRHLVMICAAVCFGCATSVVPLCSMFWIMVIVHGIQGIGNGVLLTGCFTMCGQLWATGASARSFMQSFQLCMPVGAILSPLMIAPFLSNDSSEDVSTNATHQKAATNMSSVAFSGASDSSSSSSSSSDSSSSSENRTSVWSTDLNTTVYLALVGDDDTTTDQQLIIPFAISGAMLGVVALLFAVTFCWHPKLNVTKKKHNAVQSSGADQKHPLSLVVRITRLYLIGQMVFLDKGIENSFSQFFPTFLQSKMEWTKFLSSDIMSLFWGLFAFGRLLGIAISYFIKSTTHIFIDILLLLLALIVLLAGTYVESDSLMWLSAAVLGIAVSTLAPCLVSWSHGEILSTSGGHTAFLLVTCSLGSIVLPLIIGNVVELDYIWFVYVLLISSIVLLVNHFCLFFFARLKLRQHEDTENIIKVDNGEATRMT